MISRMTALHRSIVELNREYLISKMVVEKAGQSKKVPKQQETQVVRAIQLLEDIRKLLKEENKRDRKRGILELYDKHYKKILTGTGGIALASCIAAGAVAGTPVAPVLTGIVSGVGLSALVARLTYFLDCNGKFQDSRRGRDIVLQALVQTEEFKKIKELRKINDGKTKLPLGRLKMKHIYKVGKLLKSIKYYTEKMEKRDLKTAKKELKDIGKNPSNTRRRLKAKELAKKEFESYGIGKHLGYFSDPERELVSAEKEIFSPQTGNQTPVSRMSRKAIGEKVRQHLQQKRKETTVITQPKTQLQSTIEELRVELPESPSFSNLYEKLLIESQRLLRNYHPSNSQKQDTFEMVK